MNAIEQNSLLTPEQKIADINAVEEPIGKEMLSVILSLVPYYQRYQLIAIESGKFHFNRCVVCQPNNEASVELPAEVCILAPIHYGLHNRTQFSWKIMAFMLSTLIYLQRMELLKQNCTIGGLEYNILQLIVRYNYYPEQVYGKQLMEAFLISCSLLERAEIWGFDLAQPNESIGQKLIPSLKNDMNNQDTRDYLIIRRTEDQKLYKALNTNGVLTNIRAFWHAIEKRIHNDKAFNQECLGVDMTYLELTAAACIQDKRWYTLIVNSWRATDENGRRMEQQTVERREAFIMQAFLNTGRVEVLSFAHELEDGTLSTAFLQDLPNPPNANQFQCTVHFQGLEIICQKNNNADFVYFGMAEANRESAIVIIGSDHSYLLSGIRQPEMLLKRGCNVFLFDNRFSYIDIIQNIGALKGHNITSLLINAHGVKKSNDQPCVPH